MERLNVEKYTHVYTFFGADSKVGTTMIATSLAKLLAETNKVLLIYANKKPSLSYVDSGQEARGIDNLQIKLESNVLDIEDINDIIISIDGLDIIPGVRELELCRKFKVQDINEIIDIVMDKYDIILIDAGCDFEYNAMAVGALSVTDNTVLVTTQQETAVKEMNRVMSLARKMKLQFNELLVNKLQPSGVAVIEVEELQKLTGIKHLMGEIKNSPYSWQSESDYSTLIPLDKTFKKKLEEISIDIAENLYINKPSSANEKRGLRDLFNN